MERRNFLSLIAVSSAVLVIPNIGAAARLPQDEHDERKQEKKEDKSEKKAEHKEHEWNEAEDKYYRQYLSDRHEKYREYQTLKPEEQDRYWEWRDAHRDKDHDRDDYDHH